MNSSAAEKLTNDEVFSERQNDVLGAAFSLIMNGEQKSLTMAGVAAAANCSKESLYKWFGDREGLLAAMVVQQAAKVPAIPNQADAKSALVSFGQSLIEVLYGPTSIALNRLAIGDALSEKASLGALLIEKGRQPIKERGCALLADAKGVADIDFDDVSEVYGVYYGLLLGDTHISHLLGKTSEFDSSSRARRAVDQLYQLYPNSRS